MKGSTDLSGLIKGMTPKLNQGEYVFVSVKNTDRFKREDILGEFKETEGTTLLLERTKADHWKLPYTYVASWITLTVHSSLEAVGLTAAFSTALAEHHISCNVIAAYYHDHIFVEQKDAKRAVEVLNALSENQQK